MEKSTFEELARRLAARSNELHARDGTRPKLAIVPSDPSPAAVGMDAIERESHCRMIRHIRRRWGFPMQVLIDQACFGVAGLESLQDDQLVQLHKDLERAQDCMRDGVTFEDAGLLKARYG